ncbi:hypothetical protein JCM8547_000525 [Rhodosporidiobolus lusitaniae]
MTSNASVKPCWVCGKDTTQMCGNCREVGLEIHLCSREHQKLISHAHKRLCGHCELAPLFTPEEAAELKKNWPKINKIYEQPETINNAAMGAVRNKMGCSLEEAIDFFTVGSTSRIFPYHFDIDVIHCMLWSVSGLFKHTLDPSYSPSLFEQTATLVSDFCETTVEKQKDKDLTASVAVTEGRMFRFIDEVIAGKDGRLAWAA